MGPLEKLEKKYLKRLSFIHISLLLHIIFVGLVLAYNIYNRSIHGRVPLHHYLSDDPEPLFYRFQEILAQWYESVTPWNDAGTVKRSCSRKRMEHWHALMDAMSTIGALHSIQWSNRWWIDGERKIFSIHGKMHADAIPFIIFQPPQHFLNFRPLPQGHGSLRPIFGPWRMAWTDLGACPSKKYQFPFSFLNSAISWCRMAFPFSW